MALFFIIDNYTLNVNLRYSYNNKNYLLKIDKKNRLCFHRVYKLYFYAHLPIAIISIEYDWEDLVPPAAK